MFVHDEKRARVVLAELKQLGVQLALDDFDSQVIVNAIIQLAHALKMTVVSEGVETAKQHAEPVRPGRYPAPHGRWGDKPAQRSMLLRLVGGTAL